MDLGFVALVKKKKYSGLAGMKESQGLTKILKYERDTQRECGLSWRHLIGFTIGICRISESLKLLSSKGG